MERGVVEDSTGRAVGGGTDGGEGDKGWEARGGEGGEDASGEVGDNSGSLVAQN